MATIRKVTKSKVLTTNPSVLVLQWLTYAFWGWTVFAAGWLTSIATTYYLEKADYTSGQSEAVAYSLAAVIVLLVISLICDGIYSKKEQAVKNGPAMLIMIVHAVIFALLSITGLIASVFGAVNLLIGNDNISASTIIIVGLVVTVLYGVVLTRVLRFRVLRKRTLPFILFMVIVIGALLSIGVAGPASYARETRQDRLIEQHLPQLAENIRLYSMKNDRLPASLRDIRGSASISVGSLIDQNLVEYTPGNTSTQHTITDGKNILSLANGKAFEYSLCVSYVGTNNQRYMSSPELTSRNVTPDSWSHPNGRVCYDLITQYAY